MMELLIELSKIRFDKGEQIRELKDNIDKLSNALEDNNNHLALHIVIQHWEEQITTLEKERQALGDLMSQVIQNY